MTVADPQARLATLPRADGSATYAYGGYKVTASVNGPLEAQRRDEDPDEANVDVIVRPAAGVGGPSERNLESILQKTLQDIILVQEFPRCSIQIVLQVQAVPENDYVNTKLNQPGLNLPILPPLLHTAVLALLSSNIPMRTIATAVALAILTDGRLVHDPLPRDAAAAQSVHVFAFTGQDDELLLAESEGAFSMATWDTARAAAWKTCCQPGGMTDEDHSGTDMRGFIRSTIVQGLEGQE